MESAYWAIANRSLGPAGMQIAAGVAVSIRCVTQVIPAPYEVPKASAKRQKPPRAGCSYGGNLRGYNKELRTQYAHSPTTGQNLLLDPTTRWNEMGPRGPGYYRSIDGRKSYQKLVLGQDDDC